MQVIELAVRMGETMLVAGAPASEVTRTIVHVADAYGMRPLHVDVTYNSITTAGRAGDGAPVTTLRVVHGAAPRPRQAAAPAGSAGRDRDGDPAR